MTDTHADTLARCPIGLFWAGETLCLKTAYSNNEGRIDAYIVESGEFFWGAAPQSIASQRSQIVVPINVATAAVPESCPAEASAFDLLERLCAALEPTNEKLANDIAAWFARGTGGVSVDEIVAVLVSALTGGEQ